MKPKKSVVITMNIISVLVVLAILSPLVLLFVNGFRQTPEILKNPIKFPEGLYLDNFVNVFSNTSFLNNMKNSFIITASTVFLCILVTAPAGYALSRFRFIGKRLLVTWLLASQAFPAILMAVGFFSVLNAFNLLNTLPGLIILYTTFTIPFCCWLLKGYFDEIPISIEEAAMVDGCNRTQAFVRVVMPIAIPGLIAVGTFAFMLAWNEFFFALVVMRDNAHYTLPVFLSRFVGTGGAVEWGNLSAGGMLTALPPVIIFLIFQKYLISGLTKGAIK